MAISKQNRDNWEDVYQQAHELRQFDPWGIFPGELIFRLESEYATEELWCMFMGGSDEVAGLNIYLGEEGLRSFRNINSQVFAPPSRYRTHLDFFQQKMLQVEYVFPDELEKGDRQLHKLFNISASGYRQGIKARLISPGLAPQTVPDEMLPLIADCLEQCLLLCEDETARHTISTTSPHSFDHYLRVQESSSPQGVVNWQITTELLPEAGPYPLRLSDKDKQALQALQQLPQRPETTLILHLMCLVVPVEDNKGPASYPFVLVFLEPGTGFSYPPVTLKSPGNNFAKCFCRCVKQLGYLPGNITCSSSMVHDYLSALEGTLDFAHTPPPPHLEEAETFAASLFQSLGIDL